MPKNDPKEPEITPMGIIPITCRKVEKVTIDLFDFGPNTLTEKKNCSVEDCYPYVHKKTVTWIRVIGLNDMNVIKRLGKHFGVHPLVVEYILNTRERAKISYFPDHIFMSLKNFEFRGNDHVIEDQISIIFSEDAVITFEEQETHIFDRVIRMIQNKDDPIRHKGTDYLAYCLLDAIIMDYFKDIERLEQEIENLESQLISGRSKVGINEIYKLKRKLIFLRKSITPLWELLGSLTRVKSKVIDETTRIYLDDLRDHTKQVIDTLGSFGDVLSGIVEIYLSSIDNRLNSVMKVLTVISTIFIPLTFVTGIYGMNFRYMPELENPLAYPLILVFMFGLIIFMLSYFRLKKWL